MGKTEQMAKFGKQLVEAGGPTKWAFARITEFAIGAVIGTTVGIADELNRSIMAVTGSFTYAGGQLTDAFATVGGDAIGAVETVLAALATAATWAGPLGPFVYIGSAVVIGALAWRVGRAILDAFPVASGLQTLLEGS